MGESGYESGKMIRNSNLQLPFSPEHYFHIKGLFYIRVVALDPASD